MERALPALAGAVAGGALAVICMRCATEVDAVPALGDDAAWLNLCHAQRLLRLTKPSQSAFRVTAVVVFRARSGALQYVTGHNDEACNLANSCCAERAAFLQMAAIPDDLNVLAVYITTDASFPVTPGALCREYMNSSRWTSPDTPVVMEGVAGPHTRTTRTLGDLWPLPSPYTRLTGRDQMQAGRDLGQKVAARMAALTGSEALAWQSAVSASKRDGRGDLHPLSFGACMVFRDGTHAVSWQKKALEYSCSLDAVCQLAPAIETTDAKPSVLCMADQFGLCHAPFAPARAYLVEHGWGDVRLLVHDSAGVLHTPTAEELMPSLPLMPELGQ